jgi:hypothetical protein
MQGSQGIDAQGGRGPEAVPYARPTLQDVFFVGIRDVGEREIQLHLVPVGMWDWCNIVGDLLPINVGVSLRGMLCVIFGGCGCSCL